MRILMLTDLYPPFIGGIEQHVRNLGSALQKRGHEVAVATMSGSGLAAEEIDQGVRVYRLRGSAQRAAEVMNPSGRPYAPPFPDPEVTMALRRIAARERPQIVHGHNWLFRSFVLLKAWGEARLVVTLHDYGLVCAKRSYIYREAACAGPAFGKCLHCAADNYGTGRGMMIALGNWAMQRTNRWVDMFLPVSKAVAEGNELARRSLPFVVLPNFVPDDVAERFDASYPTLRQLPDEPYLLYVGALSRHKGVHILLAAYERLEGAPPLVLIGPRWRDTPQRFPRNTIVLESLPHGAVMAAWRRSSAGVVPSLFPDPCPTVAMEAMASGKPVVASRIGGLPDIVNHGTTGLLVTPGDPGELRAALRGLTEDPEAAKRMGRAARREVAPFTESAVVERLETIYANVLKHGESGRKHEA